MEVHQVENPRFEELGFRQRRGHAQQRLVREQDRALRQSVHVAREPELRKSVGKGGLEMAARSDPVEFLLAEAHTLDEVERLLQPSGDQEISLRRELAHEKLKHRRVGHAAFVIRLQHGELVEVRKQWAGNGIHPRRLGPGMEKP